MIDALDLRNYNRYIALYQMAVWEKDDDRTLALLEQMLEALMTPWKLTESALYYRMAPETKAVKYKEMQNLILQGMENDPEYESLRRHPRYKSIVEKYQER